MNQIKEVSGKPVNSDRVKPAVDANLKLGQNVADVRDMETGLNTKQLMAIYNEVSAYDETLVSKMPERLFAGHFLRVLAGLDPDVDNRVALFYKGANGYHYPVDIVDARGFTLFRVPPLYQTKHINPLIKGDKSPGIASIVGANTLMATVRPREAKEFTARSVIQRVVMSNRSGFKYEDTEAEWLKIFEYYNIVDEVKAKFEQSFQEAGLAPEKIEVPKPDIASDKEDDNEEPFLTGNGF